jgi:hypothetical protein
MAGVRQYMNRVAGWEMTTTGFDANAQDLLFMQGQRDELAQVQEEFKVLSTQQAALTASKQETTKKMQEQFRRGEQLVDFLRTGLRQHYGKDSEKLVEFGLQPFRPRPRSPKAPPPLPEAPAPSDLSDPSDPDTAK